jgi:hypothetical protein
MDYVLKSNTLNIDITVQKRPNNLCFILIREFMF